MDLETRWIDDDFDADGALGYWDLGPASKTVWTLLNVLYSWRNELNLPLIRPTKPDPDGSLWVSNAENLEYADAACSQAAMACIVPLVESLIRRAAIKLREHYKAGKLKAAKQSQGNPNEERFWYLNKWPKNKDRGYEH